MKKIVCYVLITLFVAGMFSLDVSASENEVKVVLNGITIPFDQPPVIESRRVLVPMRAIFEAMGAEVEWEDATKIVTVTKDDIVISMQPGNNIMTKNNEQMTLDVPPALVTGRTLIPIRAVSEVLGAILKWDETDQICYISTTQGQVADGWFFYSNIDEKDHLYKIDSNGNHRRKLSDLDCFNPVYNNGWIYFQDWSTNESLYRVDLNGENQQRLTQGKTILHTICDGWIYYSLYPDPMPTPWPDGMGTLYRMRTDGTENMQLTDDIVRSMDLIGDTLYVTAALPNWFEVGLKPYLYKMNTDGTNKEPLFTNDFFPWESTVNIKDDYLYSSNEHGIYRINLIDKNVEFIYPTNESVQHLYIMGDRIVYGTSYGKGDLMIMDLDGKNNQVLAKNISNFIRVFEKNNRIYYVRNVNDDLNDKEIMFSCNLDGSDEKELFTGENAKLCGDRIYFNEKYDYIEGKGEEYTGIYSVDLDGTDYKCADNDVVSGYEVINNKVYYAQRNTLKMFRCDPDGSNKIMITTENSEYHCFAADNEVPSFALSEE